MTFHVHDSELNKWGEIVNKEFLKAHADKFASTTEAGHVKIDDNTIKIDINGVIKIADDYLNDNLNLEVEDINNLQNILDGLAKHPHLHTMDDVQGLLDKFDDYADFVHGHEIDDIDGLRVWLESLASKIHIHTIEQITGLQSELDNLSLDAKTYTDVETLKVLNQSKDYIDTATLDTLNQANLHSDQKDVVTLDLAKDYVDNAISNLNPNIVIEDASLTVKGVTQLSSAIDSEDEDKAATPKAIKDGITETKSYIDGVIDDLESTLTDTQFRIPISSGQSIIPIENSLYSPSTHILLLFDNTTKVMRDEYTISESTTSSSGYEINLQNPPTENKTYEIVLIHGKALFSESTIDNRFHDGATPPINRSLIWTKTS